MIRRIVLLVTIGLLVGGIAPVGAARAPKKKVLVMGVDGLDPKLLQQFMDAGDLPNFRKLVAQGDFKPLTTSMPPLSPVAWSNFITGMDSGGHGIYDFIHREPETLIPFLSMSRVEGSTRAVRLPAPGGDCDRWVFPLSGGTTENLRRGTPFWELLKDADVPTTIFKMPANFPPDDLSTRAISGMGTPDILGTTGTFSYYTNRPVPNAADMSGGDVYLVSVVDNVVEGRLHGPDSPVCEVARRTASRRSRSGERETVYDAPELTVPFQVYLDPEEPVARFVIGDEEFILQEGEWSDWVPVDFEAVPVLATARSMGRFYLKQVRPDFKLYVSPLQISLEAPALPITHPESWSKQLYRDVGPFYTQELAEDTKAFVGGIFTGQEFWQQSQYVFRESRHIYEYMLDQWKEGLLFFYFSSIDQGSHMLWHFADPEHPGHTADEKLHEGIRTLYRQLDEVLGRTLARIDDDTTLVVMSDHGFCPFYWQIELNSWLVEKGWVTLRDPSRQGSRPLFGNVDWSRTKAYALGLNGLYLNLKGRESRGVVDAASYQQVLDELERDLLEMVDPKTGRKPVSLVIQPRRDYHGPFADQGPDILVGYDWGYRTSWKSPLGEFPPGVVHDNHEPWSGDHSVDYRKVPGVLITNGTITMDAPALFDLTVGILDEYGVAPTDEMLGQDCLGPKKPMPGAAPSTATGGNE